MDEKWAGVAHNAPWQSLYEAAMLEVDLAKLPRRIEQARYAIQTCRDGLGMPGCEAAVAQRRAMMDALNNLRTLERVEFAFEIKPAWGSTGEQTL